MLTKQLRYLVVGAWNTVFGCALYAALYTLFGGRDNYIVIVLISHLISVAQAWALCRKFVFRSTGPRLPEYLRFNLSSLLMLGLQVSGMWAGVHFFEISPIVSQIAVVSLTVIVGYLVHHYFSFAQRIKKVHL